VCVACHVCFVRAVRPFCLPAYPMVCVRAPVVVSTAEADCQGHNLSSVSFDVRALDARAVSQSAGGPLAGGTSIENCYIRMSRRCGCLSVGLTVWGSA
jgi:hypothetical protein